MAPLIGVQNLCDHGFPGIQSQSWTSRKSSAKFRSDGKAFPAAAETRQRRSPVGQEDPHIKLCTNAHFLRNIPKTIENLDFISW
jgi:hypothetical protein